ncbi:MAG: acetate/propionate family kinase [Gammaproteobacteria bacterium]|nr:acetate/propionate family kinase [Gammaproteobacteria bacterium]MBU0786556.1 acetate/propionate family kinase [Gammaproteobacteria bacterium]MBU0817164.1 acetate/propionate family kinase [Gammaproteobacteria bacterium]MBU1787715.1 acetate/propionate family kinase [Gammaproteobacteria bacterium]
MSHVTVDEKTSTQQTILVINSGSSSVKFALFSSEASREISRPRLWSGAIERIGLNNGHFHVVDAEGAMAIDKAVVVDDHNAALRLLLTSVEQHSSVTSLAAVGHRVVHGGPDCDCPAVLSTGLEKRLHQLIPLAPLHQPGSLAGIEAIRNIQPDLLQVACFDTSFHHALPKLAKLTGLPHKYFAEGVRRYGFHGLSYEYVVYALKRNGVDVERERIVVAHLGNGASMCALMNGKSVDTTMGFSTLAGLPMGTRCGDLDPGVLLYLMAEKGLTLSHIEHLLYEESGLLGMSGLSRNMEDLLARPALQSAVEAVDYYVYQARRQLAGLTATLGGLDRLIFTGGIGANSSVIRSRICAGLEYLGITVDSKRNEAGEPRISTDNSQVAVEAFETDEEFMIAKHVHQLMTARTEAQEKFS